MRAQIRGKGSGVSLVSGEAGVVLLLGGATVRNDGEEAVMAERKQHTGGPGAESCGARRSVSPMSVPCTFGQRKPYSSLTCGVRPPAIDNAGPALGSDPATEAATHSASSQQRPDRRGSPPRPQRTLESASRHRAVGASPGDGDVCRQPSKQPRRTYPLEAQHVSRYYLGHTVTSGLRVALRRHSPALRNDAIALCPSAENRSRGVPY